MYWVIKVVMSGEKNVCYRINITGTKLKFFILVVSFNQSEDFLDILFVWSSSIPHSELTSLFPRPVFIPGGEQLSTMADIVTDRYPPVPVR
jgi:hypothetical protein